MFHLRERQIKVVFRRSRQLRGIVKFDAAAVGRRVAVVLFDAHPGSFCGGPTLDEMIREPADAYVSRFISAQRLPGAEVET